MTNEDIDRVIELVVNDIEPVDVGTVQATVEQTPNLALISNEIAVRVARRLEDGSLDYEPADVVMNWLWGHVTTWLLAVDGREMPEPMYSIYDAVDAGEYRRPDDPPDVDPVEKYTMPAIESILESLPPASEQP